MKKTITVFICILITFCASCSLSSESAGSKVIKEFRYDVTDETFVAVKEKDGLWTTDPFVIKPDSIVILTYSENEGWNLNSTQKMGINCDLESISESTQDNIFIGNIANGKQNSAIPIDESHLGISMSFGAKGEYYIYFMNTSSQDISVSNVELWIQDEGKMDKYIF